MTGTYLVAKILLGVTAAHITTAQFINSVLIVSAPELAHGIIAYLAHLYGMVKRNKTQ